MKNSFLTVVGLTVCLTGALLACKKKDSSSGSGSGSERAASLKTAAKQRLGQLAALAPKVAAEPAVKADKPVAAKPPKASLAVIGDKWLSDPTRSKADGELGFGHTVLSLCKHNAEGDPKTEDDLKYLEQCAAVKTVAVIRERSMKAPKIKSAKSFDSGEFRGDAFVYELESGKLLGSYMIIVSSDPELRLPGTDQTEKDWLGLAMADLSNNAISKVEQYLE